MLDRNAGPGFRGDLGSSTGPPPTQSHWLPRGWGQRHEAPSLRHHWREVSRLMLTGRVRVPQNLQPEINPDVDIF